MKKIFSIVTMLLFVAGASFAQDKKHALSPKAVATGPNIKVEYCQPSMRNREIFGKLVPYGQVWRTGANEATEITFKKDCTFGGEKVKAGVYTLFTIPEENQWTVILNSELGQWGAFGYDKVKDKDVLHVTAPVKHISQPIEKFTIKVAKDGVTMMWEKTSVTVPVKWN